MLDMCGAPGGKATAVAILMKDKGEVVAVEIDLYMVKFLIGPTSSFLAYDSCIIEFQSTLVRLDRDWAGIQPMLSGCCYSKSTKFT